MRMPTYNPTGHNALRQALIKENKLLSLDQDRPLQVIPSRCYPLDYVTGCGGLPRGRVVVIGGPESSGKCVGFNTFVPVINQGIMTFEEIAVQAPWSKDDLGGVKEDQHVPLNIRVPGSNGEPVNTTDIYFAGVNSCHKIITEDGHELIGSKEHRILSLTPSGLVSYVMLRDIRIKKVIIKSIGHKVTGPVSKIFNLDLPVDSRTPSDREKATACLLGALSGAELRDQNYYILVTHPYQMRCIQQWVRQAFNDDTDNPFDETLNDFSRFSGLVRIKEGFWTGLTENIIKKVPALIRKSSLNAQIHWCSGLTLARGVWTQNDLECEIQSDDVARTLHLLLENIGIRCMIYQSANTFALRSTKVALRNRISQQMAQEILWKDMILPRDWKGCSVKEEEETHEYVSETLKRAREILVEEGKEDLARTIDLEDLDKENILKTAEFLFPLSRRKRTVDRVYESLLLLGTPHTYLDRVVLSKVSKISEPLVDLRIPIGHHYLTNGLVSHNSTLALHYAGQELESNPKSVIAYLDYEHSMYENYARKILKNNYNRFDLIRCDMFEDMDKLLLRYFRAGVFPSMWIVDSVPAMAPEAMFGKFNVSEDDDDEGKKKGVQLGLQAALLSQSLSRWVKLGGSYGVTFVLLNQIRAGMKINKFQKTDGSGRGSPGVMDSFNENTPGGYALRFYNSMSIDLRPRTTIKAEVYNPLLGGNQDLPVANSVVVNIRKNKCGIPHRSCLIYIEFGKGVDEARTVFDLSLARGFIKTPTKGIFVVDLPDGTFFSVRGQENFINALKGKTRDDGPSVSEYLKGLLQWDKAAEMEAHVIGFHEQNESTGEYKKIDDAVEGGHFDLSMLNYVRSQPTFIQKADALELLVRKSKSIYWTSPKTGTEYRAMSLEKLFDKLPDDDVDALVDLVNNKISEIESKLAAQDAESIVQPTESVNQIDEFLSENQPIEGTSWDGGESIPGEAPAEVVYDEVEAALPSNGEPVGEFEPVEAPVEVTEGEGWVEELLDEEVVDTEYLE